MRALPASMVIVTIAAHAVACPDTTNRPFDSRDGQLSQDIGGAVGGFPVRAADDFSLPTGNNTPWNVREIRAVMLADWTPTLSSFGVEVLADAMSADVGAVPGAREFIQVGAAGVTDLGAVFGAHHAYEVRFSFPTGACTLPPGRWHWLSVYAVAPIPGNGSAFWGTGGNTSINGVVARKNTAYPTGPWRSVDECCIGPTDLAFRITSRQSQTPAADVNCSGSLSVQDLFDYLAMYFAGGPAADFNFNGAASVQDLFDFLACYFSGCQ